MQDLGVFTVRKRPFTIEHIYAYTHMTIRHINVIIMLYLKCSYVLMGCYVSIKNNMNTQEKKLDISTAIYIIIMVVVFTLGV